MASHPSSHSESTGGFWSIANKVLAAFFGIFALYWGGLLFFNGLKEAWKQRQPAPPAAETAAAVAPTATAAAPSAAPAPAAEKAAAPAAAATAAPAAANGPVAEITIKPDVTNPLTYDTKSFTVKSGQKVKFTFNNTHPAVPQPHNWVLGKPGTKDKLLAEAMKIMTDPKALEKGYIPESSDVLQHTKLLQPNTSETLEFVAPAPGEYPYVCTFPGHGILMNGVMKVE